MANREHEKNKIVEYYYNSLLFSSDDVIICIKKFLQEPNQTTFTETAIAMRNDIWEVKKYSKIIDFTLNGV